MYQLSRFSSRERQVARADHHRNKKVTQHGRNRRNQKQKHHHDPVHAEQLVIRLGRDQITLRREKFQPYQDRERRRPQRKNNVESRSDKESRCAYGRCVSSQDRDRVACIEITASRRGRWRLEYWGAHRT